MVWFIEYVCILKQSRSRDRGTEGIRVISYKWRREFLSQRNQIFLKTSHSFHCPLPIPFPDCQLDLHEFSNHWSILRFLYCGKQEQRPPLLGFALLAA
ncbi:hypothetical protein VNO80_07515 [Phaseolus coccineus]|uniref:Uncharacterized protein n=1 Tax=Phaseolus coccineus TaxID=3886 RepID=A0AAN9RJP8_PHACN